jgi:hypothetical protein
MAKVSKYNKERQTEEYIGAPSSFNLKDDKIIINAETELGVSEIVEQLAPIPESIPVPEPIPESIPVPEPIPEPIKPTSSKATKESTKSTTMPEINPIIIKLEKPAYIKYIMQNTGEESTRVLHDQKIALSRGTIYKLPITTPSLNLQNSYVIRVKEKFADIIRILNVAEGFVTIEPLIHGVVLVNGDEIAVLI